MANGFLDRLRALFRSGASSAPTAARPLYVEEDDWGDVEVLPAEMMQWWRAELDKIAVFANAHRASDDSGWTDIYVRQPAPMTLAELRMPLAPVLEALGAGIPLFDRVTSGSFSAPEAVAGARAFGLSAQAAVIVARVMKYMQLNNGDSVGYTEPQQWDSTTEPQQWDHTTEPQQWDHIGSRYA